MVNTVPEIDVQKVTVIDPAKGGNATKLAAFTEQLRESTGIDLPGIAERMGQSNQSNQNSEE